MRKIQGQAFFVPVIGMEKLRIFRSEKEWSDPARKIPSVVWIFYLDYLRALVCQKLGAERTRAILFDGEHPHVFQRKCQGSVRKRVPFHPLAGDNPTKNLVDSLADEQQQKFCRIQFLHASFRVTLLRAVHFHRSRSASIIRNIIHCMAFFGNEHRPFITDHFLSILVKARGSNRNNSLGRA